MPASGIPVLVTIAAIALLVFGLDQVGKLGSASQGPKDAVKQEADDDYED